MGCVVDDVHVIKNNVSSHEWYCAEKSTEKLRGGDGQFLGGADICEAFFHAREVVFDGLDEVEVNSLLNERCFVFVRQDRLSIPLGMKWYGGAIRERLDKEEVRSIWG